MYLVTNKHMDRFCFLWKKYKKQQVFLAKSKTDKNVAYPQE